MPVIKVIVGATRPNRFGIQPAEWIMELAKEHPEATFELVDLAEHQLPLLDEGQPAASGVYENEHTKAWSKVIDEADGFIFVTPEYNYGTSAALKNAIDYLAAEWRYKPVSFVAYGVTGGVRAVLSLRQVVANLSMYSMRDELNFVNYWSQLDADGKLQPTEAQTDQAHKLLSNTIFWSDTFKTARQTLGK